MVGKHRVRRAKANGTGEHSHSCYVRTFETGKNSITVYKYDKTNFIYRTMNPFVFPWSHQKGLESNRKS